MKVEKLKNADTSAMITLSEDMRRMQDMMKMYGMSQGQMGTEGQTLVLLSLIHIYCSELSKISKTGIKCLHF